MTRDEFDALPKWVQEASVGSVALFVFGANVPDGPVSLPAAKVTAVAEIIMRSYLASVGARDGLIH